MTSLAPRSVHGTRLDVHVHPAGLGDLEVDRLVRGLEAELGCFPVAARHAGAGACLRIRGRLAGEDPDALFENPSWIAGRVTPWLLVRAAPQPPLAELVVLGPGPVDELVLAAWARAVHASLDRPGSRVPPRAALHAASLVAPAGGALLLGESGAGKTTLSRLLTHEPGGPRFGYLGDEDAVVELPPGAPPRLLAFPRRLRLVGPGAEGVTLPGQAFRGFGEEGLVADRPPPPEDPSPPLRVIYLLEPDRAPPGPGRGEARDSKARPPRSQGAPDDEVHLADVDPAAAAFALLRGLQPFPVDPTRAAGIGAWIRRKNRDAARVTAALSGIPVRAVRYTQPAGFASAAHRIAEDLARFQPPRERMGGFGSRPAPGLEK